ncbi:MAG TPA: hypothetical protein VMH61_09100 [Candidatus Acidoferrales bacterium]|nr:hypothetical protein [Candidatus Acidoferrales bacterium]
MRTPRRPLAALLAAALLASLGLTGCGRSSSSTAPTPTNGTLADLLALIHSAYIPGAVLPPNVDASASLLATMELGGVRAASALFVSGTTLLPAGTVDVRVPLVPGPGVAQLALDQLSTPYLGVPQYAYTTLVSNPAGVTLPFDGASFHAFSVQGSGSFPAFSDSVQSVTPMSLTLPADMATVSRASDLTVTWTAAGADTSVYVTVLVTSAADSTRTAAGVLVRDSAGSTTVPAAQLGLLPAGGAKLGVARYRLRYAVVSGHRVGLACESTKLQSLTLD